MISISIIGSVARRAGDILSDKDLLAVGDKNEAAAAVDCYVKNGWNVSRFSRDEFEALARSKSLFVQHVKQDGRPVRDDGGYLKAVMSDYKMQQNYFHEMKTAIIPIETIGEAENNYWGLLFQADILYVAVRNACILYQASVSNPEFDFVRLVQWIGRAAGLTEVEAGFLLKLRSLKFAYRGRIIGVDVSHVCEAIRAAKKLSKYLEGISGSMATGLQVSNGYFDLRVLEGRLVSSVGPIYMDDLDCHHALADMWSVVCNPSNYDKPRLECLPTWSGLVSAFLSGHRYH